MNNGVPLCNDEDDDGEASSDYDESDQEQTADRNEGTGVPKSISIPDYLAKKQTVSVDLFYF